MTLRWHKIQMETYNWHCKLTLPLLRVLHGHHQIHLNNTQKQLNNKIKKAQVSGVSKFQMMENKQMPNEPHLILELVQLANPKILLL